VGVSFDCDVDCVTITLIMKVSWVHRSVETSDRCFPQHTTTLDELPTTWMGRMNQT